MGLILCCEGVDEYGLYSDVCVWFEERKKIVVCVLVVCYCLVIGVDLDFDWVYGRLMTVLLKTGSDF